MYEVPVALLDGVHAEIWKAERAERIREAARFDELPPIKLGWNSWEGLVLADGNHRLSVHRERGWETIRVVFWSMGPKTLAKRLPAIAAAAKEIKHRRGEI